MIELLLLLTWVGIGVASAVALAPRGPGRLAWAPVAAVLGPLWPAVASEQARGGFYAARSDAGARPGGERPVILAERA